MKSFCRISTIWIILVYVDCKRLLCWFGFHSRPIETGGKYDLAEACETQFMLYLEESWFVEYFGLLSLVCFENMKTGNLIWSLKSRYRRHYTKTLIDQKGSGIDHWNTRIMMPSLCLLFGKSCLWTLIKNEIRVFWLMNIVWIDWFQLPFLWVKEG